MYSKKYCACHKIIFMGSKRSVGTTFQKKWPSPRWEKKMADSFSYYRAWQTSCKILLVSTEFSDKHCASYKIVSVKHKRSLKAIFSEKKPNLPMKKMADIFLYHQVSHSSENNLWEDTRHLTIIVQVMYFSIGPKRSIEINISK